MNLGQFCIFKEDSSVWQIVQIKPLFIKEVTGPNTSNKKISSAELESQFTLIAENSVQHKSVTRILERIPLDHLNAVKIIWSKDSNSFELSEYQENEESSDSLGIIDDLTAENVIKGKKRLVSLIKHMTYAPNVSNIKEHIEKQKKNNKSLLPLEEFKEGEVNKKNLEYQVLVPNEKYNLEKLILAPETKLQMNKVILNLELGDFIGEEWGLNEVVDTTTKQPLNFQGPPGTGKTLAAKSIGTRLNKKILQVDYSQLFSKWVGETGKNIQKYFNKAKSENMILFFDEADALLTPRHRDESNPSSSTNQNIFMQELDKFDGIVILTTNHFQHYDEALFRRFRHVEFKLPTPEQREELFKIHVPSKVKLTPNFNWDLLVKYSSDFSGGDIKNVVEQTLSSKATILRNQNRELPLEEFKNILREVVFTEEDFIIEINQITSNKKSFKSGNASGKLKLGLIN